MSYRTAPIHDSIYVVFNGVLQALDPTTGGVRWQRVEDDILSVPQLFANTRHLYALAGATLRALDTESGATQWQLSLPLPDGVHRDITFTERGDSLFVHAQRVLCCVDPTRGALRWHQRAAVVTFGGLLS